MAVHPEGSREGFARLIGTIPPSVAAREGLDRMVPLSRTVDLQMQFVAKAVRTTEVPALNELLDGVKQWTAFPFGVFDVCHRSSSYL
jgi:hypothetical protein